jgi:hypothetical protein
MSDIGAIFTEAVCHLVTVSFAGSDAYLCLLTVFVDLRADENY